MRIIIDMQGAQAENRKRGIGRYSLSIAKSLVRNSAEHEVIIILNGLFPETIEPIRSEFDTIIDQHNIRVWTAVGPVRGIDGENKQRKKIAELTYEAFIAEQNPDFIYVTSLFEGLVDDAVTSIHSLQNIAPIAVTLFDLIPHLNPSPYLDDPSVKKWYEQKIMALKKADVWFAISESSRQEGIKYLSLSPHRVYNISTDADEEFKEIPVSTEDERCIRERYGLNKSFIMYTGGIDHRKNIEGLVRSYAKLPEIIRSQHQLAIICSIQPGSREILERLSEQVGLKKDELVLTGFVPGADLVTLYNLCRLFVFPSLHEGFGLPALEAMRCGAAVIGSNTSSLPEVIGWEEALFDPNSVDDMVEKIERGLLDEQYRDELLKYQKNHNRNFSWDKSAKYAIGAMEKWVNNITDYQPILTDVQRPSLAFVSPLPPARSGIADYSAELLPVLSKYYNIDIIIEQDEPIQDAWIIQNLKQRNSQWLIENHHRYDRILYHFGNSAYHQHMFGLLKEIPGVVVLHDFFLSGIQAHRDIHGIEPGAWPDALLKSHGYQAVYERFTAEDTADVVWKYPANLPVLQRAKGIIAHSEHSRHLASRWYQCCFQNERWHTIPLPKRMPTYKNSNSARKALGFNDEDIIVCAFGVLGQAKLNHRLLEAWIKSPLSSDSKAHLVFVGQGDGDYVEKLINRIKNIKKNKRIKITGWASPKLFTQYLQAADIGVQLRTMSRGETSAAVLDCMNYGLATIVNAHGSMVDIDPDSVWMLPDYFTDDQLVLALTELASNKEKRVQLGERAQAIIRTKHEAESCAALYFKAIESIYKSSSAGLRGAIESVADLNPSENEMYDFATAASKNFPPKIRPKQLLVDISELVQRDAKSGIQRVVRAILRQWLTNPPDGFLVQPVYATEGRAGYSYARQFVSQFLGIPYDGLKDEAADAWQGDTFIGLDLQPQVVPAQKNLLEEWRNRGVNIWFVIYDLLPVLKNEYFPPEAKGLYSNWLKTIAEFDGVACISKAVAEEFKQWLSAQESISRLRPINIDWFHLGADILASAPSEGLPAGSNLLLKSLAGTTSFLMVGTIEPRKGHVEVLEAFDLLWGLGAEVNLVVVGKQGWMVEELCERLRNHSENGRRLFWLEAISDEYLEKIYSVSTCLIAASYGEGFGLPLIEAAQHKIPILARDIPVFREVAGHHAFYFSSAKPDDLATAIRQWIELYETGDNPASDKLPWLTWRKGAEALINILTHSKLNRSNQNIIR